MPRVTTLFRVLKSWGLTVEYVPGWSTRGSTSFDPVGVVGHWTAGPRGTDKRPSLRIVTEGRPSLPGPLCNVYLDRRGVCVIVAAGRANHAGKGAWRGYSGNSRFLGIEAEAADNADWTDAQREAYPILCAALLDAIGSTDAGMVCGHSEYAGPRKIDINGYTPNQLRAQTQSVIDGLRPVGNLDPEEDLTVSQYTELKQGIDSLQNSIQSQQVDFVSTAGRAGQTNFIGALEQILTLQRQILTRIEKLELEKES
ncbi:peptidoglycan recognition protein family protein [Zhihengliuella flava]|uniref:N-acetylmuramoyl-L-alanine amidase domain-containing protein n=1 Tax=Zhihengliuella flava TaxID=1285193 RepID=A0A931DDY2_9MICC|nr:N-acetylmuramoyl-L-alanine amidase [Zhihengliuella flava]MBG6085801.1 hypothetical protein [Zhihengliuella flava]MBG6085879.1 hypothetical protein [Zhihengliuella flava]